MKIKNATVLLTNGSDKVLLDTVLPCPHDNIYLPSQPSLKLEFTAKKDTAIDYLKKHFRIEPNILSTRTPTYV